MSTARITAAALEVRFTPWEKLAGLVGDVAIPLHAVRAVQVLDDGIGATRGLRAPGLGIPGRRKVGTWRGPGRRELVDVRRGQPAVRVELAGYRYTAAVLGIDDAASFAGALRAAAPAAAGAAGGRDEEGRAGA